MIAELLSHSPLALLLVQIATIMLASRALGALFRRLRQPLVVAEIVAGILLGPSLLGTLWPDAMGTLFPASGMAGLGAVSQLGLVLFMFTVGLEFDVGLVRNRGPLALVISQYGIVVPFLLGTTLALALYPLFTTADVPFVAFGLFMGASMSVTAFPVLARILSERGLMRSRVGALTLSCAAVDDVTAWCLLAFTIAVVRAGGLLEGVRTTVLALVFIAGMVGLVRPFLARLGRRYGTEENLGQTAIAAVLFLLLLAGLVAELIGIHALFGAFLFGAVVPREGPIVRALTERVEDLVVVLLLPLFFAFTGLRTSIGLVDTPELWGTCLVVVTVACVGKLVGTALPARLGGMTWRESGTLGVLMNTRGLMELIILNIGRDLGVLSPLLFTMLVIMAVVTTFITSPIVAWLYPPERVLAERAPPEPRAPASVVMACVADPGMAPSLARLLAAFCAAPDARGVALGLTPIGERASLFPEAGHAQDDDAVGTLARYARGLGAAVDAVSFPSADPSRDICAVADVKRADLVLLGLHRPLMGTAWLGGPLLTVAQELSCDAGMFQDAGFQQARRVLLARGGPHDAAARRIAERLARGGARVVEFVVPAGATDPVEALIAAAEAYDLVVVGVGPDWDLSMHAFDLREHPLISRLPCSLLAAHGPEAP